MRSAFSASSRLFHSAPPSTLAARNTGGVMPRATSPSITAALTGCRRAVGVTPASGATTTSLLHAGSAAVIEGLVARGITPPVFLAANVDGGAEWNKRLLAENADRIFYL